jgi:hypothetical protein
MRIRKTATRIVAAFTGLIMAGGMLATAAPASANTNDGYVSGAGIIGDDWGDEGTISTASYSSSNATCLWQRVLWAEGLLSYASIDGIFGPNTKAATESFQGRYSDLTNDGKAGPNTWGKADNKFTNKQTYADGSGTATYSGSFSSFTITRGTDGRHRWFQDGATRAGGYNYRSCS